MHQTFSRYTTLLFLCPPLFEMLLGTLLERIYIITWTIFRRDSDRQMLKAKKSRIYRESDFFHFLSTSKNLPFSIDLLLVSPSICFSGECNQAKPRKRTKTRLNSWIFQCRRKKRLEGWAIQNRLPIFRCLLLRRAAFWTTQKTLDFHHPGKV